MNKKDSPDYQEDFAMWLIDNWTYLNNGKWQNIEGFEGEKSIPFKEVVQQFDKLMEQQKPTTGHVQQPQIGWKLFFDKIEQMNERIEKESKLNNKVFEIHDGHFKSMANEINKIKEWQTLMDKDMIAMNENGSRVLKQFADELQQLKEWQKLAGEQLKNNQDDINHLKEKLPVVDLQKGTVEVTVDLNRQEPKPVARKPFNLHKCMAGEKVITRSGDPYQYGSFNADAKPGTQLIGWVRGNLAAHNPDGTHYDKGVGESVHDLFMA